MKLKHQAIHAFSENYFGLYKAFKEGSTIREWINNVDAMSKKISKSNPEIDVNKFKGDMLEVFAEIFFNSFQADERIGIRNYTPILIDSDFGVDAKGINVNGHACVVQVKYRTNPTDLITYSDIAKTFTAGVLQHKIPLYANDYTVFLFTTSSGISGAFNKIFEKTAVIILRKDIAEKVDNNKNFWLEAYSSIYETLD